MTSRALTMVFAMDPIESIDIRADTSFVLMLEAQRRGHRVLYLEPRDLSVVGGRVAGRVRPVTLRREQGNHADLRPAESLIFDEEADVVFQRKDPPVDADYVAATQILALCERALVLNRPEGLLTANEKLYTLHFRDLMPPTRVTRRIADLLEFMEEQGGEMVVKPLDGKGGEGIFHIQKDDRNLRSILEQSTRFETRWIMAQRYLEDVRRGDKRILLVDGELLGGFLRVPSEGEHRANLHVGGRAEAAEIDDADRRIIDRLAPSLRRDGLFFVGIDVIGGYLTEVNVTSPTGIQELNALTGGCAEARILDRVEARVAGSSVGGGPDAVAETRSSVG